VAFDPVDYLRGTESESSLYDNEVRLIYKYALTLPFGCKILELGILHGRSACLFGYIAAIKHGSYTAIDMFERTNPMEAMEYFKERGLPPLHVIVSHTAQVHWCIPVDLLHIDTYHYEPNVSHDIKKFVPFVKVGGIVAFDGYQWQDSHVKPAVDAYCGNGNWENLGQADDLKVFRRLA